MGGICKCTNPIVSYPQPPCSNANCVRAAHVYVKQEDSIFPCGETLDILLTNKIFFDTNQDKAIATFHVLSLSPNLINAQFITTPGNVDINFRVTSNYSGTPATDYHFGTVTYKVRQGILSDIATITIPFKYKCADVEVPSNKTCDPCDGLLVDKLVNMSVGVSNAIINNNNIIIG